MEHGACEEVCSIELSDTVFHFHVSFTGDRALDPETNRQESVALCMRGILLRNFIASFFVKDDCSLKMALQSFSSVLHVPQVSAVLDVAFVYECFSSQVCFQMFPTLAEEWEKEISKTEDATLCAWLVQFFCLKQALATQELVDFAPSFFWILVKSFCGLTHFHIYPSLQTLLRRKRKDGMLMSGTVWHSCLGSISLWREMLSSLWTLTEWIWRAIATHNRWEVDRIN